MTTPWDGRALHLVGIGGIGMSGLAIVAAGLGARVTGSDRAESPMVARLRGEFGIEVFAGHDAAHVPADAELVVSSAIAEDNPERAIARSRGQRELHRSELLGELTRARRTIAVTGTHGKTTTSAMVVAALTGAGMDPGYLVGGELAATGSNAGWGSGEWLVVEADESDRSLLALDTEIAVLTNAELDHHATYGSLDDLLTTFARFLSGARVAVVHDEPVLRGVVAASARLEGGSAWPAGTGSPAGDDRADEPRLGGGSAWPAGTSSPTPEVVLYDAPDPALDGTGAEFEWRGRRVRVGVAGAHNAVNAAGALEACLAAGADPDAAAAALASFGGTGRRFQTLGTGPHGVRVIDDYAHHPTEVAATLAAARTLGARRVVAIFQPHLYSRTRALAREFGEALAAGADVCGVLDVYPARERAEAFPGVSGRLIAETAADAGGGREVAWLRDFAAASAWLDATLRPGDVLLVMGAGDVDALGRAVVSS